MEFPFLINMLSIICCLPPFGLAFSLAHASLSNQAKIWSVPILGESLYANPTLPSNTFFRKIQHNTHIDHILLKNNQLKYQGWNKYDIHCVTMANVTHSSI